MVKIYTKEYAGMLEDIFTSRSNFLRAFGGEIQIIDGAEADKDYLNLKIVDTDVVIQEYNLDENVAFGEGTGSTNRFGKRTEVKAVDKQVPFDVPLAIHEGVDRFTVNDIPEDVVADRLAQHAVKWTGHYDSLMSKEISNNAGKVLEGKLTDKGVTDVFSQASKEFVQNDVSDTVEWVAYVKSDVYNLLIDSELAKIDKGSSVNIDDREMYKFKGFILQEVKDNNMSNDIYFAADNVGVAGLAIPIARIIDADDFAGVTIQGAGKLGKYLPEKNKKAIVTANLTAEL